MRHLKSFKQLNRTHAHRRALYRNMLEALFKNERIKTTKTKAKEIRRIAERFITKARNKTLHNIRIISKLIKDKAVLMKLFNEIAPRYIDRNGGYTRIIKLGTRKGDAAEMAYLEMIEEQVDTTRKKKKKKLKVKEATIIDTAKQKKIEEKADNEKADNEKVDNEKVDNEKVDNEKVDNEKVDNEKVGNEKVGNEKEDNEKEEIIKDTSV